MRAVVAAIILWLFPTGICAQTIQGVVRDDVSGEVVAGAALFLTDARGGVRGVSRSRADGTFVLKSVAGDTLRIRAEAYGYATMESGLLVLAAESQLDIDFLLEPTPVALDPLTVTVRLRQSRNREGFERRRRAEIWGKFVDHERLARVRSPRAINRLQAVIPGMVAGADGVVKVRKRGADLTGVPSCTPRYYIDGVRFPGDMSLDGLVQGESIRAVEYYSEPQWAPAQFTMGVDPMMVTRADGSGGVISGYGLARPCAVIVIWTEFAFGSSRE